MRNLLGDFRFAFRTLAKSPGFTLIAILSIALGVGANTATYSFVDALLFRPLPVKNGGTVVSYKATSPGSRLDMMSYPDYVDVRDRSTMLDTAVAFDFFTAGIGASREALPQTTVGYLVSGNFFSGLGIELPIGRGFQDAEDREGAPLVTVIGHSLWERYFHSDPNIVGKTLRVSGAIFTVIGVAPAEFSGPEPYVVPDLYVPYHHYKQAAPMIGEPDFLTSRKLKPVNLFARLKPGVSMKTAQAEAESIMRGLAAQYPETNRDRTVTILTYQRDRYERAETDVILGLTLMGITAMVLLIACANVANLLLARGTARVKEIAIRIAIGAGRGALLRQLLTESMVLALLGGAAGLGVGFAGVRFLQSVRLPADIPLDIGIRMDMRLLIFSMGLSLITGIIFGLVPALRATRMDLSSTMKTADQGPGKPGMWRGRLKGRNVLVVAQLALSVVLLVASGMFVRGFAAARTMDPGFRIDHTLLVSFNASLIRYDEAKSRAFYHTLIENVRTMPGVQDAALADSYPFNGSIITRKVVVDGYRPRVGEETPYSFANIVDDHYFATMDMKLVRGRTFDARDTATSPRVVIINEVAAKKFFPNRDALGAQFRLGNAEGPLVQVVGIAKTGTYLYWAEPPTPFLYIPFTQEYRPEATLTVHTRGNPPEMAPAIRDAVRAIDPDMPVFSVRSMDVFYDARAMLGPRLTMQMVTAAGSIGLLLAIIGLYGVVAYAVGRRTREIGIRMAVGAKPLDVLRMVLTQGLGFTLTGLGIGLFTAFFASRALAGFVVGVSPHDPAIFIGAALILALVMLAACWLPARRAARIDPLLALRQD